MTRSERSERMARVESLLAGVKRVKDKINTELSLDRPSDEGRGRHSLSRHHVGGNSQVSRSSAAGSGMPPKNMSFNSRMAPVSLQRRSERTAGRRLGWAESEI